MANDFKRFCVPDVGTSNTTLYTVPNNSGAAVESIVIGITMANKTTSGITGSIFIDNEMLQFLQVLHLKSWQVIN